MNLSFSETTEVMMKETIAMVRRTYGGPGSVEEKLTLFTRCTKYISLFCKLSFLRSLGCSADARVFSLQRGLRGD
ncbi:hypothetical protein AHF37_07869 [Paragonimus kellicotti]|nr:hypothetical protein AHF37_07869 [Paragonimus kellicotti]